MAPDGIKGSEEAGKSGRCDSLHEDVQYWQFLSGKLTATGDYTSAEFAFVYENNGNEAWFDGAQLFREPFDYVYTYDNDGNLTSVKNPDGTITTYTYVEGTSDVASITLPGGGQYSYTYNDNHRLTRSITATGLQTDYGYDACGNSTSVTIRPQNDTGAAIRSDSTYTADGNMLASTTGGDRNTVTYTNDTDRSLVTAVTDAQNAVTSYSYDAMRRQTGVTGADGRSAPAVHEPFGQHRHGICLYLRFPRTDKQNREEVPHARKRRDHGRNARDRRVLRL